jgi:GlcNAc-PI de-N-acetylase
VRGHRRREVGVERRRGVFGGLVGVGVVCGAVAVLVALLAGGVAGAVAGCRQTTVVGVAHQDDDLLFINPDTARDYRAGRCLVVVYLTTGDDGLDKGYWFSREQGVQQAYAAFAGVPNVWTSSNVMVNGRTLHSDSLSVVGSSKPGIQLVFLRLPDGFPQGGGSKAYGYQSLLKLYTGKISRIVADDHSSGYTSRGLLDTLTSLLLRFKPTTVRTLDYYNTVLDYSITEPVDHSDHSITARYFREAVLKAQVKLPKLQLAAYEGYSIAVRPPNLPESVEEFKETVFRNYVSHEQRGDGACRAVNCPVFTAPLDEDYALWVKRFYPRLNPVPARGTLVSWMGATDHGNTYLKVGRCLERGSSGRVTVDACFPKETKQQWQFDGGVLRDPAGGGCLLATAIPRTGSCTTSAARHWRVTSLRQLQSRGRCLSQDDLILPHARLRFVRCDVTSPSQRWFVAKNVLAQTHRSSTNPSGRSAPHPPSNQPNPTAPPAVTG